MNWIKKVADQRARQFETPADDPVQRAHDPAAKIDLEAFAGAQVSDKILIKYGAKLKPVVADMLAAGQLALALRPHKAVQFNRALDRFYGDLGKFLDRLPEEARTGAAKDAVAALKTFVEQLGAGDRMIPLVETLSSMLFTGSADSFADRTIAAARQLGSLLDDCEGRLGTGGLLLGFRNLSEIAAKDAATLPAVIETWQRAASFLVQCSPASGLTQGELGTLVGHYLAALKASGDRSASFDLARQRIIDAHAPALAAGLAQLDAIERPPEGTGARLAVDELLGSLSQVLKDHSLGPKSVFDTVSSFATRIADRAKELGAEDALAAPKLAKILKLVAGSAASIPVLEHLRQNWSTLLRDPTAVAAFAKIQGAEDVPRALIAAKSRVLPDKEGATLEQALQLIDRLPPVLGAAASLAAIANLDGERGPDAALAIVQFARGAETVDQIKNFGASFASYYVFFHGRLAQPIAFALGAAAASDQEHPYDWARGNYLVASAQLLTARLPGIELSRWLRSDRPGEIGLLQLEATTNQNRSPFDLATPLIEVVAGAPLPVDTQVALVKRMFAVGLQLARLDREPQTIANRIREDLVFLLENPDRLPAPLKKDKAVGVQGQGNLSVLRYLESHPEIPPELALSAARSLSAEQFTWLVDSVKDERSHGKVRQLRDLIFALIEVGRLDLLEPFRQGPSAQSAKDAFADLVVREYRQGRVDKIAFDPIKAGLEAGRDPIGELRAAESAAVLVKIIPEEGRAELDPAGAASLVRNQTHLFNLLSFFPENQSVWGLPAAEFRDPLVAWLQAYGKGRVKELKFDSPISAKMLEGLSDAAKERWRNEGLTSSGGPALELPEHTAELLNGLAKALGGLSITYPAMPKLKMDAASEKKLGEKRDALLTVLRANPKGSDAHRASSGEIGPILDRLAVLALKRSLDRALGNGVPLSDVLAEIRGDLESAGRAAKRLGGLGIADAINELKGLARKTTADPRKGPHVTDEYRLEGYLNSFGGSCMNPSDGFNRGVLVEKMCSARYKMCLGWDGDKVLARSFLRLLDVEVGDYKGKAIWLDHPCSPESWGSHPEEVMVPMYGHALDLAMSMGIPFFCKTAERADAVANARHLEVKREDVTVVLEKGHTGTHHTQQLGPIAPYGVRWPGCTWNYGESEPQAGEELLRMSGNVSVIMPKAGALA